MKRSEMVCSACIKFDSQLCRLMPEPIEVEDPESHWCAQGQWQKWSDRYHEMEPFYWGEWSPDV